HSLATCRGGANTAEEVRARNAERFGGRKVHPLRLSLPSSRCSSLFNPHTVRACLRFPANLKLETRNWQLARCCPSSSRLEMHFLFFRSIRPSWLRGFPTRVPN